MIKRKGSLLENNLAIIFERVGFDVKVNSKEFGWEADVIARRDNFTILIQTKQYENSYINITDLLHQWASKGKNAGVDRVVLVIWGINIPQKCYSEAKELDIYLWDSEVVKKLQRLDKQELSSELSIMLKFGKIFEYFNLVE